MKKYEDNIKCGFATALLCTIWMFLAGVLQLPGWAGFAGCTAYFAAPGKGVKSLPVTLSCVVSGILYAACSIWIGGLFSGQGVSLFLTFLTTFLMCMGGSTKWLCFVPGAFIGSFSTFASGGDVRAMLTIVFGVFLGLACDSLGQYFCKKNGVEMRRNDGKEEI